jgi:hypothetical protein
MNAQKPDNDRLAYHVGSLNLSGLTITKVILWLVAITIVSFVIGFGILALSGELPSSPGNKVSPFRQNALVTPNSTPIPLEGATSGSIRIMMGAGEFTLGGGAGSDQLMQATVYSNAAEWQPDILSFGNGTGKTVTMIEKGNTSRGWFAGHSPTKWEVRVNEIVPLDLNVEVGAGESRLNLGSLNLTSLVISNGAGETTIDLAGYHGGQFTGAIHNGVGDLTLRVTQGSNTRVLLHHGVGDVTIRGFEKKDETYTTAGFSPALPVTEFTISQGVGSIQLEAV